MVLAAEVLAEEVKGGLAARLIATVLIFAGLEGVIFHSGLYARIIEPDSTTGIFELTFRDELQRQAENGDNMVATVGDSRFAYLPRQANLLTRESGLVFRNAGAAGTDARAWYYMLRDLDPTAHRYRAIVFGVNDYSDEDEVFVKVFSSCLRGNTPASAIYEVDTDNLEEE